MESSGLLFGEKGIEAFDDPEQHPAGNSGAV